MSAVANSERPSVWRERLASPLTWHYVGFALLLVVSVGLATRLGLDWTATDSHSVDVLAGKQVQLKALEMQTAPLRGLDKRLDKSRAEMDAFYLKRIPPNYSTISTRIDDLGVSTGVRLTRTQYTQGAPGQDLTEIDMDSSITGEYPAIMHFVNGLERDPIFFVIKAMNLTGQQGGQVSLRMQVATWLRPAAAAASGLPPTPPQNEDNAAPTPTPAKEGE
jgi:type IV pilus assembly protein PilO